MPSHRPALDSGVREQMLHESVAMCRFALASGMSVPAAALATIESARAVPASQPLDLGPLSRVHDQLCKLVAPATPRALLLLGDEHESRRLPMLGPVGLVRRLMTAAAVSTLLFVLVSLSPAVNDETVTVQNATGIDLFTVEMFWIAAAAMGASFCLLMQVSGYVVKRNYDPKYESSYWIKFLLGIMAGFILVALVPIDEVKGAALPLARPALALLGGFSASAVYRILTRLVEAVESLFTASARDQIAASDSAARARTQTETSEARVGLAGQLVALQHAVAAGESAGAVSDRLRSIVAGLVNDGDDGTTPSASTAVAGAASSNGGPQPDAAPAAPAADTTPSSADSGASVAAAADADPAASTATADEPAPATVAVGDIPIVSPPADPQV